MTSAPRLLHVALGEYDTGWQDPARSLARARALVREAAGRGADVVVLPEMAPTGFSMDPAQAVEFDSPVVADLAGIARSHAVWLIAGVALREDGTALSGGAAGVEGGEGRADGAGTGLVAAVRGAGSAGDASAGRDRGARRVNAALALDPTGTCRALYRKRRLFAYGEEHTTYTAGEAAAVVSVHGVRLGLLVCYELRFPELFLELAPRVEAIVVIANWPAARRAHWDTLLRARAIENQCVVIGVNRRGEGGGERYDGGSAAFDAWGEPLPPCGDPGIVTIDPAAVSRVREEFPLRQGGGEEGGGGLTEQRIPPTLARAPRC